MLHSTPIKILNVNDDESGRYFVTRILQKGGFQVVEAASGEEGRAMTFGEKPALVILDVKLPDISGFEVCRKLKENAETASIPVLHLTANALSTQQKVQGLQFGADAYLTFPLEPDFLLATVKSLIRMRSAEMEKSAAFERERAKSERLARALEELEKERELRDRFIATLTHDLRSPLSAIRMSAQLALRRPTDVENVSRQTSKIVAISDRADRMIQDLLDASVIRAGEPLPIKPQPMNLGEVATEILEEFASQHGDRFKLNIESGVIGNWDRSGLKRVIENLVLNAVKYGAPHTPVRVGVLHQGDCAQLCVRNEGNPISAELLPTLFEPFKRATVDQNKGKPGWGLGLTLVRGMIEAHGGTVQVESSPEDGTTFSISLPKRLGAGEHIRLAT